MDADRWNKVKQFFAAASELPAEQRDEYLRVACGDDESLRAEVESLLVSPDQDKTAAAAPTFTHHGSPSLVQSAGASIGANIGPYKLSELIGEGGMGEVWRAEQTHPIRRTVALKLIKLGMDSRAVIARFEGERQALALMNHANVARVLDAGTSDSGRPFFVMEYVPGESITHFCDRHHYTTRQRLELFTQACEAVQHAHQKAIIHRDLKPSNILVTLTNGKALVKVIDFGVAKATAQKLTERTLFTETGTLVGTPEYMSPEQAEAGGTFDIDTRSDVYSLGVVLYELLAGALPFDSKSLRRASYHEIQRIIREVEPPRPSTRLSSLDGDHAKDVAKKRQTHLADLTRQLSGELAWIPMKAMRKDRAQRYATADQMAEDIRNYVDQKPLLAAPESASYRLKKFLRRNRGPVSAAVAIAVVLLAGITISTIALIGQSRARAEAERQKAEALKLEAQARRSAETATAVQDFQIEMLETADPDRQFGDKVTVLQAMQVARKQLDAGRLGDQPLVEAAVRNMIGNTVRKLGRYDAAEPNLLRALELMRKHGSPGSRDLIVSVNNLAFLYQEQSKPAEAEALFRESVNLCRARVSEPKGETDLAIALNNLANALRDEAKPADAEMLYREALAIWRRSLGNEHRYIAIGLNNVATTLSDQGRHAEAESLLREALEITHRTMPAGHRDVAERLNNLAMILRAQGKAADAEPLLRQALEITRSVVPAGHVDVAFAASNLAGVLGDQGKLEEAEALLREAAQVYGKALPPAHPDVALSLDNLARVLAQRGKLEEAQRSLRDALEIRQRALGEQAAPTTRTAAGLADLLDRSSRSAEASALRSRYRLPAPSHP